MKNHFSTNAIARCTLHPCFLHIYKFDFFAITRNIAYIVWMNFRVEQKFGVTHTLEARQTWTVGTKHKRFSKTQVRPNRQRFSTNLYFLLFSMKLFVYFTFFHTLRY